MLHNINETKVFLTTILINNFFFFYLGERSFKLLKTFKYLKNKIWQIKDDFKHTSFN